MELKKYVTYQQTLIPIEERLKSVAGHEVYLAADVDAQLAARVLKWTTDKPTVPGWYWWREYAGRDPEVCHVYEGVDGELRVDWTTDCGTNGGLLADYDLGQFAGPIAG